MQASSLNIKKNVPVTLYPYLPYSIVFDVLHLFKDCELNKKIYDVFSQGLPLARHYDNSIDLWVDLEASGNITLLNATRLAEVIIEYVTAKDIKLNLSLPSNAKLTSDNQYLLNYLLRMTNVTVTHHDCLLDIPDYTAYQKWDCFIDFKILDFENDSATLCNCLWRLAEYGAEELAFTLFEEAISQVHSSYIRNLYLVQLQFMRIASMHYCAAAEEPREVYEDFSDLQRAWYLTKAWGNILSKRETEAGHYFKLANVHENLLPENIDQLYKMNIFALYQHLKGNTSIALAIETKIKNCILSLKKARPQITYVNAINLARLYRHMQDFPQAKAHYDLAFANANIESESHEVYKNICYCMLYEKSQEWDLAFSYCSKAWIAWCKMQTKEALAWRAVRAIGLFEFNPHDTLCKDQVNNKFLQRLNKLAENMRDIAKEQI